MLFVNFNWLNLIKQYTGSQITIYTLFLSFTSWIVIVLAVS